MKYEFHGFLSSGAKIVVLLDKTELSDFITSSPDSDYNAFEGNIIISIKKKDVVWTSVGKQG